MHFASKRRTATKIKSGRVQRKNRGRPTGHHGYILDRESPGRGFRHVVSKRDINLFVDLIPNWDVFSERLERIVLTGPSDGCDGFYEFYHREETGAIFLHAWREDLWFDLPAAYFDYHQPLFEELGLSYDRSEDTVVCRFTEAQARAFMLLHIFMHELGHHYDRINQKHLGSTKGEDYAEIFANSRFFDLFPKYISIFGHPGREA